MADLVHIRLDKGLREEMRKVMKDSHYSSETEFIRDSIRKNLEVYQKLRALMGSAKRRTTPPPSVKNSDELFRKYGLDGIPKIN